MPASELGTIDPDRKSWGFRASMQPPVTQAARRDAFGKPIDGAIRLERPNRHSRLRLANSSSETMQRAEIADRRTEKRAALAVKRAIDLGLGSVSLLLLSPVFAAVALAIKMQSDGPVFYASERVGVHGSIFRCYKFRTMVRDAESLRDGLSHLNERAGILFKISKDPRVTRLGAMLRKYSVDELPQLINVLRGEMSLVGPRPSLRCEVAQYDTEHFRRLAVLPGMTGLWQVEARRDPSFDSYVALDCKYANDWSLWLDLKILARTFRVVILGTGV